MTSSIANTNLFNNLVNQIQQDSNDKELHWLVSSIIIPEFQQIIETLKVVSNLILYNSPQHPNVEMGIERGPSIKLPLTSTTSNSNLNGIIIRDGLYILKFNAVIKDHYLNKYFNKLNLKKPILLNQLVNCKNSIDDSIELLNQLRTLNDTLNKEKHLSSENHKSYHKQLIISFENLLNKIQLAKTNLQLPIDPSIIFPQNIIDPTAFEPILPKLISIDFYINQAEICIDLKNLNQITEKPWSEIHNGKSYVDLMRDEIKNNNNSQSNDSGNSTPSTTESNHESKRFFNLFKSNKQFDKNDYITRCITYNNMVVMINSKIEVSSEDPILVSCFTKLDSIEYLINNFLYSLNNLI
ncbi:RAV2 [Candida pseudojiufengensis]|uniref:RAV2 n=1 Tax=Candida pseudojiufengensis TaxID=497109 RepID=UPI002224E5AE|nr:RAV2 [Candida pseudojiufengensis]KAI5965383.1 RAV2 [Candida pseudojiufengensis]